MAHLTACHVHAAAGELQIMDVYTNALFKGAIKRARCMELFNYFQGWKVKRLQQMTLAPAVRALPPFDPPKPTLASGLQTAFQVCTEVFSSERYRSGMRNAFYQRSQFHDQDPIVHARIWLRYSAKRMGVLKPTEGAAISLGSSHPTWILNRQQMKMCLKPAQKRREPCHQRMRSSLIKLICFTEYMYECVMSGRLSLCFVFGLDVREASLCLHASH